MKHVLTLFVFLPFLSFAQPTVYPYSDGKKWGLTNEAREVLLAPQIDENFRFYADKSARVKVNGKVGVLAPTGKFTLPPKYDAVQDLSSEYGTAKIGGKQIGVNMKTGKEFGAAFDEVMEYCFCETNYYKVRSGKKFGLLDPATSKLVGKLYDNVEFDFENRKAVKVTLNKKQGVIEMTSGKVLVPIAYDRVDESYYSGGGVSMVSGYKAINGTTAKGFSHDGKEVELTAENDMGIAEMVVMEEPRGDGSNSDNRELFVYSQGNNQWKITFENRGYSQTEILEAITIDGYDKVEKIPDMWYPPQHIQYVRATKNGKVGLLDQTGKVVIPIEYDEVNGKDREYYITKLNGLYGIIDKTPFEVRKPELKSVGEYSYNLSAWLVELPDGRKGYLTPKGKILIPGLTD
ncbi:MAG TPA: WG repeat-containing protein [Cyclobacteriaceae bacterium]|nr:WG repeat-containing protein [Cyclobacteriaceae bacterium]